MSAETVGAIEHREARIATLEAAVDRLRDELARKEARLQNKRETVGKLREKVRRNRPPDAG